MVPLHLETDDAAAFQGFYWLRPSYMCCAVVLLCSDSRSPLLHHVSSSGVLLWRRQDEGRRTSRAAGTLSRGLFRWDRFTVCLLGHNCLRFLKTLGFLLALYFLLHRKLRLVCELKCGQWIHKRIHNWLVPLFKTLYEKWFGVVFRPTLFLGPKWQNETETYYESYRQIWSGAAPEKFDCKCYGCAPKLTGGAPRPPFD